MSHSVDPLHIKLAQEKAEWDAKQREKAKSIYVVITDIDIPFTKLIAFLVKLSIAAVPAAIIAAFVWMILTAVLVGIVAH